MRITQIVQFDREESRVIRRAREAIGIIDPTEAEAKSVGGIFDSGNNVREDQIVTALVTFRRLLRKCELDQCTKADPQWVENHKKVQEDGRVTIFKDPHQAVAIIHETRERQALQVQVAIDLLDAAGRALHGLIKLS